MSSMLDKMKKKSKEKKEKKKSKESSEKKSKVKKKSSSSTPSKDKHDSELSEIEIKRQKHQFDKDLTLDDFDIVRTVGTGTFGRVLVVKYLKTEKFYAIKVQKKSEIVRLKQVQHIKNEKNILTSIDHPYIVNLLASFQDASRIYFVMEFVTGGEMFSHLRRARKFDNERAKFYAAQIVSAFAHLHKHDVIYRDLKPENLLIDHDGHVKVTDFGFAKVVKDKTYTVCGTPEYIAPEIIRSQGHATGADWWALGVLIYEMLAGFPPFFDEDPFGIYEKILSDAPIAFPSHFHKDARDLIRSLLQHDLTRRFGCMRNGADDIKNHKWFSSINWKKLENREATAPWQPPKQEPGSCGNYDKYPEEKLKFDTNFDGRFGDQFKGF